MRTKNLNKNSSKISEHVPEAIIFCIAFADISKVTYAFDIIFIYIHKISSKTKK